MLAFPKPKDVKKEAVAVKVYRDGREVCQNNSLGKEEYKRRKRLAWIKQKQLCSLCGKRLLWSEATIDHIKTRKMGGGSRDDRQGNIAAAHGKCNTERGSKVSGFYE